MFHLCFPVFPCGPLCVALCFRGIESASRMRQRRFWWIAAPAACMVSVAGALVSAQRPSQSRPSQSTFRASIDLVQIDAVVVDEHGRHVRGLTANEFRIFDRGKPQAIAAFEEVTHSVPRRPRALTPCRSLFPRALPATRRHSPAGSSSWSSTTCTSGAGGPRLRGPSRATFCRSSAAMPRWQCCSRVETTAHK